MVFARLTAGGRVAQGIVHVLLPLSIGGALYLTLRSEGLQMFSWVEILRVDGVVDDARALAAPIKGIASDFLIYTLPDALWVYSLASAVLLIWQRTVGLEPVIWLGLVAALGVGGEVAQEMSWVPGTFDRWDLGANVVALCAAWFVFRGRKEYTCV